MDDPEVIEARKAIRDLFAEAPRPRQKDVAAATGLSQGYVAKIAQRKFTTVTDGIRKVWEYSKLDRSERSRRSAEGSGTAQRLSEAAMRLASRDPALIDAVIDFVDRLARR